MYFETELKTPLNTLDELSLIYTPGVGFSSKEIAKDKNLTNSLTNRANCVGVIFDTTEPQKHLAFAYAVCAIIKKAQNIDAYPLVSTGYDINKIIEDAQILKPTVMCAVPRFYQKIYEGVIEEISKKNKIIQRLFYKL